MEYCAGKSSDFQKKYNSTMKKRETAISEVACQNKYARAEEEGNIMEKEKSS